MKKILYYKEYKSPVFWCSSESSIKAISYFELKMYFDFKEGLRFVASVPNMSSCHRNPFKAICTVLEHESIGMAKYEHLKSRVREVGVANKL